MIKFLIKGHNHLVPEKQENKFKTLFPNSNLLFVFRKKIYGSFPTNRQPFLTTRQMLRQLILDTCTGLEMQATGRVTEEKPQALRTNYSSAASPSLLIFSSCNFCPTFQNMCHSLIQKLYNVYYITSRIHPTEAIKTSFMVNHSRPVGELKNLTLFHSNVRHIKGSMDFDIHITHQELNFAFAA